MQITLFAYLILDQYFDTIWKTSLCIEKCKKVILWNFGVIDFLR